MSFGREHPGVVWRVEQFSHIYAPCQVSHLQKTAAFLRQTGHGGAQLIIPPAHQRKLNNIAEISFVVFWLDEEVSLWRQLRDSRECLSDRTIHHTKPGCVTDIRLHFNNRMKLKSTSNKEVGVVALEVTVPVATLIQAKNRKVTRNRSVAFHVTAFRQLHAKVVGILTLKSKRKR